MSTNISTYLSVPNPIPSGDEGGAPAYVGRTHDDGKVYLGKIGIALVYLVGKTTRYSGGPFEILTYEKPKYNSCGVFCHP